MLQRQAHMTSDPAVGPVCLRHAPVGYTAPQWVSICEKVPWMCISPSKACLVLLICWYLPQHEPRRLLTIPRQTDLSSYQKQRVPKIDWRQPLWICEALLDLWCLLYSLSNLGVDPGLSEARFTAQFTAFRLHPPPHWPQTQIPICLHTLPPLPASML